MMKRILVAAMSAAFVVAMSPAPATAQAPAKDTKAPAKETKAPPKKELTPQQQRVKDCAAEWQGLKKEGKTKGQTYNQFSKECWKRKST